MFECEECGVWKLIYPKTKLTKVQSDYLLEGMSFSCGAPIQELDLPSDLTDTVFVHDLNRHEPIEALYYSAKYEPIYLLYIVPSHKVLLMISNTLSVLTVRTNLLL